MNLGKVEGHLGKFLEVLLPSCDGCLPKDLFESGYKVTKDNSSKF